MARTVSFGGGLIEAPEPRYVRQRAMADALLQGTQRPITGIGEGISQLANTAAAGFINKRADEAEKTESAARAAELQRVLAAEDPMAALAASQDPELQSMSLQWRMAQAMQGEDNDLVQAVGPDGKMTWVRKSQAAGMQSAIPDTPDRPNSVLEFEYGQQNPDYLAWLESQKRAGATKIENNIGSNGINYGDPPKEMAWARNPDGTVKLDERGVPLAMPIQGTPLFQDTEKADTAAANQAEGQRQTADIVTQDIGRVLQKIDEAWLPAVGFGATTASGLGGTAANDVRAMIDTIAANTAFDKLAQMRQASPTGAALGSITERELALLAATRGSLEQSQTREQFEFNLKRMNNIVLDIVHGEGKGAGRYPLGGESPTGAPTGPTGPNIVPELKGPGWN